MTYRANGSYLRFQTNPKTSIKLNSASKAMDALITENKDKAHLRDEPAVKSNQNVYDSLSE
ncbi:hypothetical protein SOV_22660 [Sporomusa ovata DSM 2662]|uniref:hypothetical protein n=1 Tax=Sporomusa ovata TaxID=2378 RepID=UPI0003888DD4|nr:hypothetical protein [Sporomusa ovata]EQB25582.1 hypothetical protein SOV_4c02450 [Sporomusa ovata DSM 2662]